MSDDQLVARTLRGSRAMVMRGSEILALYARLRDSGQLARHLVVEYRCADPAACVLARVFTTPSGTFVHKPDYTYGPVSAVVGTRAETASMLMAPLSALPVACGHVRTLVQAPALAADIALAHRRGSATGRRIPTTATRDT